MSDATNGTMLESIGILLYNNNHNAVSELLAFTFILSILNCVEILFIIGYTWTKKLNIVQLFILIAVNLASAYFSLATLGGMV